MAKRKNKQNIDDPIKQEIEQAEAFQIKQLNDHYANLLYKTSVDSQKHTVYGTSEDLNQSLQTEAYSQMLQAQYAARNSPIAKGILDALKTYLVGRSAYNITPQPQTKGGKLASRLQKVIASKWSDFARDPHVGRSFNLTKLYALLVECWLRDGDVFLEIIESRRDRKFKVRLFTADKLGYSNGIIARGASRSRCVPIEFNAYDEPTKYNFTIRRVNDNKDRIISVKAENILTIAEIQDPMQIRGVSIFAPVLEYLNNLTQYIGNEVVASRIKNITLGVIKVSNQAMMNNDEQKGKMTPKIKAQLELVGDSIGFIYTPPGRDVQLADSSKAVNPHAGEFVKSILRIIATGVGLDFESIANSYENSYSAARQSMLQTNTKMFERVNYFTSAIIDPLYRRFVDFILATEFTYEEEQRLRLGDVYKYSINLPRIPNIDPIKDAEANARLIALGLTTPQSLAAEHGVNYLDNLNNILELKKYCEENDLMEVFETHFGLSNAMKNKVKAEGNELKAELKQEQVNEESEEQTEDQTNNPE